MHGSGSNNVPLGSNGPTTFVDGTHRVLPARPADSRDDVNRERPRLRRPLLGPDEHIDGDIIEPLVLFPESLGNQNNAGRIRFGGCPVTYYIFRFFIFRDRHMYLCT